MRGAAARPVDDRNVEIDYIKLGVRGPEGEPEGLHHGPGSGSAGRSGRRGSAGPPSTTSGVVGTGRGSGQRGSGGSGSTGGSGGTEGTGASGGVSVTAGSVDSDDLSVAWFVADGGASDTGACSVAGMSGAAEGGAGCGPLGSTAVGSAVAGVPGAGPVTTIAMSLGGAATGRNQPCARSRLRSAVPRHWSWAHSGSSIQ